jgi:hypothetical protein
MNEKQASEPAERPALVRPDPPGRWRRWPDGTIIHRAPGVASIVVLELPISLDPRERMIERCRYLDAAGDVAAAPWSTEADVRRLVQALIWESR